MLADTKRTGFPFNVSKTDYATALQFIPTRDLLAEVECWQWLAIADDLTYPDESRAYAEYQLAAMVDELERRQRLLKARRGDPLRPTWPQSDAAFKARIEAVKAAWPIARYCRELLGADLVKAGPDRWKSRCPLLGHDDRTPSFSINEAKDVAYCFGCQRGGDVIKLSQYIGGFERFTDALRFLERAA